MVLIYLNFNVAYCKSVIYSRYFGALSIYTFVDCIFLNQPITIMIKLQIYSESAMIMIFKFNFVLYICKTCVMLIDYTNFLCLICLYCIFEHELYAYCFFYYCIFLFLITILLFVLF